MKNRKISEDVLNILHDNTKNQDIFRDFVIDLIYQEASHQKNSRIFNGYSQETQSFNDEL